MEKDTTYVAMDDSKRKIVAGILRPSVDVQPQTSRDRERRAPDPSPVRAAKKREGPVAACYEAGVSGYDLYRQITGLGCRLQCHRAGADATPSRQRIKTDRRDAAKLVRLFRAGELTAIHVPRRAEEAVRDLVRCRDDLRRDVLRWRHRIAQAPGPPRTRPISRARTGARPTGDGSVSNGLTCRRCSARSRRRCSPLEQALARQAELDKGLESLGHHGALSRARGLSSAASAGSTRCRRSSSSPRSWTSSASARPRQLMAYLGLVPSEYSSGETQRRGALTKAGNSPRAAGPGRGGLALPAPTHHWPVARQPQRR